MEREEEGNDYSFFKDVTSTNGVVCLSFHRVNLGYGDGCVGSYKFDRGRLKLFIKREHVKRQKAYLRCHTMLQQLYSLVFILTGVAAIQSRNDLEPIWKRQHKDLDGMIITKPPRWNKGT